MWYKPSSALRRPNTAIGAEQNPNNRPMNRPLSLPCPSAPPTEEAKCALPDQIPFTTESSTSTPSSNQQVTQNTQTLPKNDSNFFSENSSMPVKSCNDDYISIHSPSPSDMSDVNQDTNSPITDQVMIDDDGHSYAVSPSGSMSLLDNGDSTLFENTAEVNTGVTPKQLVEYDESVLDLPFPTASQHDDSMHTQSVNDENEFYDAQEQIDVSLSPSAATTSDVIDQHPEDNSKYDDTPPKPMKASSPPRSTVPESTLPSVPIRAFDFTCSKPDIPVNAASFTTPSTSPSSSSHLPTFKFDNRVSGVTQVSSGGDVRPAKSDNSNSKSILSTEEEIPQFVTNWNRSKKKVFKPKAQVKRNIKKRRTNKGEESTKSSRSNRFDTESENEE
ncbi:hypothetical protein EDC96DRAFT_550397 [Choanephora cucurbitarum]|nr:hypothetical protein EDC96DRAFT_550397 [Choanephora cucurbitarum]